MHITFEQSELLQAVQKVQAVVDKKNTIPVLSNVLLSVNEDSQTAKIVATNLETGIATIIPYVSANTAERDSVTIPAQKLFEIVRELPDMPVELTVDETWWVHLRCGKSKFKVAGLAPTDFPNVEREDAQDVTLTISGDILRQAIGRVLYSTSNDESRYALTGVLWDFATDDPRLKLVTTDGHRLNMIELTTETIDCLIQSLIVPKKAMSELKKLCDDGEVSLAFSENLMKATAGGTMLYSRLIDAQFPDYQQVIPKSTTHEIRVDRVALTRALRRVSLLTSDTHLVKLSCNGNGLELSANDPNLGESQEIVTCEHNQTEELVFGLNWKYLTELLNSVDTEQVRLETTDALSPVRIVSDENLTSVIMPMRVN